MPTPLLLIANRPGESAPLEAVLKPLGELQMIPSVPASLPRGAVVIAPLAALSSEDLTALSAARVPVVVTFHAGDERAVARLLDKEITTHVLPLGEGGAPHPDLALTVKKLSGGPLGGVERYLAAGTTFDSLKVQRSSEKDGVLTRLTAVAEAKGVRDRFIALVTTVADELIQNAIFDAPVDATGIRTHAGTAHSGQVELAADKAVEVRIGSDGERVGVAVIDAYGSLVPRDLIDRAVRSLSTVARGAKLDSPGQLGLSHVLTSCSDLVVNLSPGKRTEVIALTQAKGAYRDFLARPKSFNLFIG